MILAYEQGPALYDLVLDFVEKKKKRKKEKWVKICIAGDLTHTAVNFTSNMHHLYIRMEKTVKTFHYQFPTN